MKPTPKPVLDSGGFLAGLLKTIIGGSGSTSSGSSGSGSSVVRLNNL